MGVCPEASEATQEAVSHEQLLVEPPVATMVQPSSAQHVGRHVKQEVQHQLDAELQRPAPTFKDLSLIHISEPTRLALI
eukprot:7723685-Alexandrium_andersonii.AAC.1